MRPAVRALVAYAWPVISAVIAAAHARPPSESYGQALGHEQRAEVGVAEPELAELAAVLGDLLGRVVGVADEDLLRGEHHLDGVLERLDVERVVVVASRYFSRLMLARLHAELSRCMYSLHGLLPLMRPVLGAVCHRLIVVSNCMPGSAHSHVGFRDLAHELARLHGLRAARRS